MKNKPNLIYIFADQLAYNRLGYNNDKYAKTPFLDKFSNECCVMDNAVSGHPVCAPYRASLLTGKYTTSTGMVINEIRLSQNHISFADVLNDNGYITSYMGKWHLYAAKLGDHYNPNNSFIPLDQRLRFQRFVGYNFHHRYYAPYAYYHTDSKDKIYVDDYEPNKQVDMAIDELKYLKKQNKPFAFFLSIGTPHDPWIKENVPSEYYDKFKDIDIPLPLNYSSKNDSHADMWARLNKKERANLKEWLRVYYAMVNNLDDNINKLISAIKKMGLDKDSIIVFTSDHGEMFGSHGRRAKNIFYEEALRVPFLIKYDKLLEHKKSYSLFNTVDIMPTLLDMMNCKIPSTVEGESKLKYIISDTKENKYKGSLLMCTGPTAIYGANREWRGYRTIQYTYAIYRSDKSELLFDNVNDPLQLHNLINDPYYETIKNKLKDNMYKEMNNIHDNFESNAYYKNHWIKHRVIKDKLD